MVPGRDGGTVEGAAATWSDDAVPASEWLTDPRLRADDPGLGTDGTALEWLTDPTLRADDDLGVDEAEFLPALLAIIPAVISAAPAIINAVQQLTSKPKPPAAPAPPPSPTPTPRPPPVTPPAAAAPQPTPPPPAPPAPAPQGAAAAPPPVPAPAAGTAQPTPSGAIDVLQQLAVLLPRLADLLTRPEGREWLVSSERDHSSQREHSAEQPSLGGEGSAHQGTSGPVPERAPEHAGSAEGGRGERREAASDGEASDGRRPTAGRPTAGRPMAGRWSAARPGAARPSRPPPSAPRSPHRGARVRVWYRCRTPRRSTSASAPARRACSWPGSAGRGTS